MKTMLAKCGIDCFECSAYKATVQDSDELRKKTSEEWSRMFNATIAPKSINCLGCQEDNPQKMFSHCKVCGIRLCAIEKGHLTCAACDAFGCQKVQEIWKHDDAPRQRLLKLRK